MNTFYKIILSFSREITPLKSLQGVRLQLADGTVTKMYQGKLKALCYNYQPTIDGREPLGFAN
jgi:hypothetical protein